MKLESVEITNFRCFEHLTVPLHPELTVFVANNGGGKTAILDAIAHGLAPIARRFSQKPGGPSLGRNDIRTPSRKSKGSGAVGVPGFAHLKFTACFPNAPSVSWDERELGDSSQATRSHLPPALGNKQLHTTLDQDVHLSASGDQGLVPVFAYYGTNRAVLEIPKRQTDFETDFPRAGALYGALQPTSRFKTVFEWFYAMERDELVEQAAEINFEFKLPVLEAVRRAVTSMLPDFRKPRITTRPLHFALTRQNADGSSTELYAEQLSDGYRTMLALVMDFARRLAQGNPQLPDPLAAEAILVIDEVDLHLHPIWQQHIVPDLRRTFPNTQLILTSHSPQVLTTVEASSIMILQDGQIYPCPAPTFGARSSDVVSEVMGLASLRPPDNSIAKLISKMFAALDAGNLMEAKACRTELDSWAKGFPEPDLVRSDLLIRRLEAIKKL